MAHPCMVLEGINFMIKFSLLQIFSNLMWLHCNFIYVHVDNNQLHCNVRNANKVGCLVVASIIFLVLEVEHFNDSSVLFFKDLILWCNSILIFFFVKIEKP